MKLSLVLEQARSGELKSLSPADKTDKVIVSYINLALIALYSRFPLETEEAIIAVRDGKTLYKLDGTTFDIDLVTPLVTVAGSNIEEDSVSRITAVFDEVGALPLNDETEDYSIYTPSYNSVQVTSPETGRFISVLFIKNPTLLAPAFDENDVITEDPNVQIPLALLEPMLHYIGYRAHGSVDGNIQAENNTHLMRFEQSCRRVEDLGLVPMDSINMANGRKGF